MRLICELFKYLEMTISSGARVHLLTFGNNTHTCLFICQIYIYIYIYMYIYIYIYVYLRTSLVLTALYNKLTYTRIYKIQKSEILFEGLTTHYNILLIPVICNNKYERWMHSILSGLLVVI